MLYIAVIIGVATAVAIYKIDSANIQQPPTQIAFTSNQQFQTVFIDQTKHNSIPHDESNSASSSYNPDNFVVSCSEACSFLDLSQMKCDDLAKWWNSHNDNDNDQVWREIEKIGCR